jgi:predicted Zn-dependent protease
MVSLRLSALALLVAPAVSLADPRLTVRDAMVQELERSMKRLKLPSYESPYFISYTVRDYDIVDLTGRLGALYTDARTRTRQAYVEVRVGSYQFDNTADASAAGDWNQANEEIYQPGAEIPLDDDGDALRGTLWLLTDTRYKAALAALNQKRGARATKVVEDEKLPAFAKTAVQTGVDPAVPLVVDRAAWGRALRAASAVMKKHPDVFDSEVRLQINHETRTYVTSEGTRLITESTIWGLHIQGVARADDGVVLDHGRSFYGAAESELPAPEKLAAEVERVAVELEQLRRAPVLDPYTGPAILMEEATGVLFHEVIGHRLEGERLTDEQEGQTFKGQIGQRVLPAFLDVVDDPTQRKQGATSLNGWYRWDDEGVPAEKTVLVEKGVLKTYLTSRRPITGALRSNGHGRAEGTSDPMARMGNLVVRSSQQVPYAELKRRLVEEVRKQGKPFGLILRDITGGSTNTASYGYQAFKGTPRLVYRVDAKTGDETLVRGVELVGTPLTSINKIVATSDGAGVFNGYCGAESGYVPVSTVAPAVLLTEIELQRAQRTRQRPIVLPPPWK